MTGFVVPFMRRKTASSDWSQAELAEFYRVEAALLTTGMRIETDRGVTDEGDPWFVFCHADDDRDVIIHFARDGGRYLVSASSLGGTQAGSDFRALIRQLLGRYDEIAARRREAASDNSGKVVLHPAAMLWVLVALAFLKSTEAQSLEGNTTNHTSSGQEPLLSPSRDSGINPLSPVISYALQSITVTWVVAIDLLASEPRMSSSDAFLPWLVTESLTAADAALTFAAIIPPASAAPDGGHNAPETGWIGHVGSSSVPEPGIAPIAVSQHPLPGHVDHPVTFENIPTASAHSAAEMMQTPAVVEPMALAPARLAGDTHAMSADAETNTASKAVEGSQLLPESLAVALGHAIHLTGGYSVENIAGHAKEALNALSAADGSESTVIGTQGLAVVQNPVASSISLPAGQANASAPVLASGNVTPVSLHSADPAPIVAISSAAPTPAPGPATALISRPASSDQAELAVATSAVHEFLAWVPQAKIISGPDTLIVYDPLAVDIDLAHVRALTFDFSDGSHISLVGLPSELTHALAGHH